MGLVMELVMELMELELPHCDVTGSVHPDSCKNDVAGNQSSVSSLTLPVLRMAQAPLPGNREAYLNLTFPP